MDTFTWDTTLRIPAALTALGVRTVMSHDDTWIGPCSTSAPRWPTRCAQRDRQHPRRRWPATGRGFDVLYSSPPLNDAQAGPAVQFTKIMRDQLAARAPAVDDCPVPAWTAPCAAE